MFQIIFQDRNEFTLKKIENGRGQSMNNADYCKFEWNIKIARTQNIFYFLNFYKL